MQGVTRVIRLLGERHCLTASFFHKTVSPVNSRLWKGLGAGIHTTAIGNATSPDINQGPPVNDLVETSSQAKWMADSVVDLPPQGDLVSMGMGGYSPVGLLQSTLEWIHVTTGLPWWASIISCTVMLRLALFPLAVKLQANAARMNNIRPEMDRIMAKIKQYQQAGNQIMAAQESSRLMMLYKEHNCNPLKMLLAPFLQVL